MRIGVNMFPRDLMTSRDAYLAIAHSAEAFGYDFLSVSDHVVVPTANASDYPYSEDAKWPGGNSSFCFEALTAMTFLLAVTQRIKVLSSIVVVPHRPAVLTAKMLSSMDVLSTGRVLLGVGAGWLREEFEAIQAEPFAMRGKVTDEYIDAMKELWTSDAPTYKGEFVEFSNISFLPKPVQKPHIPIWIGGESNIALKRTVRHGDAWFPGNNNPKWRVDTAARLKERVAKLHEFAEAEKRDPASIGLSYIWFYPVSFTPLAGVDTKRRMFSGSPADMIADIAALKAIGVSHTSLAFTGRSTTEIAHSMQRFADDVMSQLR